MRRMRMRMRMRMMNRCCSPVQELQIEDVVSDRVYHGIWRQRAEINNSSFRMAIDGESAMDRCATMEVRAAVVMTMTRP
jgi:hypothetical protein